VKERINYMTPRTIRATFCRNTIHPGIGSVHLYCKLRIGGSNAL